MECILNKFTDETKLGGNTDMLKDSSIFQKGLNRLEKWADRDFMKFKGKCQVLHLGRRNSLQQYRLGAIWIESSSAKSDREILVNIKLNIIKQHVFAGKVASCILSR